MAGAPEEWVLKGLSWPATEGLSLGPEAVEEERMGGTGWQEEGSQQGHRAQAASGR